MATHKSAAKRDRQNKKINARNRQARATMRSTVKEAQVVANGKDKAAATDALKMATKALGKAAAKKLVHKKAAARKISRLAKAANKK